MARLSDDDLRDRLCDSDSCTQPYCVTLRELLAFRRACAGDAEMVNAVAQSVYDQMSEDEDYAIQPINDLRADARSWFAALGRVIAEDDRG